MAQDYDSSAGGIAGMLAPVFKGLNALAPAGDLIVRLYVSWVFFKAGLTKTQAGSIDLGLFQIPYPKSLAPTDSTIMLFKYEYEVPFLTPELAAQLGTLAELCLPVLLALGLAGRFAALGLFVFNIVAVISYPGLSAAGLVDHQMWGIMLLVPLLHGPGKLSIDHLIARRAYP